MALDTKQNQKKKIIKKIVANLSIDFATLTHMHIGNMLLTATFAALTAY